MAGAIIGGARKLFRKYGNLNTNYSLIVESPALKWPGLFDKSSIVAKYPYLLPCAIAASITFTGEDTFPHVRSSDIDTLYRVNRIIISGS